MKQKLSSEIKRYSNSRRFILTAVLIIIAFAVGWFVSSYTTPYQPPKNDTAFFDSNSETNDHAIIRAKVISSSEVTLLDGDRAGQNIEVDSTRLNVQKSDTVLLSQDGQDVSRYASFEVWRFPGLVILALILVVAVTIVSGMRGFMSLGGLVFSIAVIGVYVIPMILNGADAFLVCISAAYIIAFVSLFIAHGLTFRTLVSVMSVFVVLGVVVLLSVIGVQIGQLTGIYDETSSILAANKFGIDMYGVLLGSIIIATLGILDDVVTTQVAAVDEIKKANSTLGMKELFVRGYSVGNEHIAALINTLALAYIGVSLPTVLSIAGSLDVFHSPYLILNMEYIAQEIVRTLVSSLGLVLAVPVSTAMAALLIHNKPRIVAIIRRTN